MEYDVVFDLTEAGYREWRFAAFGLIFVGVGIVLVIFRHYLPWWGAPRFIRRSFPFVFLGFAVFWTVVTFAGTYANYASLRTAMDEGRYEIVEGPVEQFDPRPPSGHKMESFVVGGQRFEYSDYVITPGFRKTQSRGGPIRKGVHVRVWHVGNDIVRLEVRR